jgi:hypothetical protein
VLRKSRPNSFVHLSILALPWHMATIGCRHCVHDLARCGLVSGHHARGTADYYYLSNVDFVSTCGFYWYPLRTFLP